MRTSLRKKGLRICVIVLLYVLCCAMSCYDVMCSACHILLCNLVSCRCVCMYVCMCVCMYVCVYVC